MATKINKQVKGYDSGGLFASVNDVYTSEDMMIGDLFGIDKDGKACLANANTAGTAKKAISAVGIICTSSTAKPGSAFEWNGVDKLRAGAFISVYDAGVLYGVPSTEIPLATPIGTTVYLGNAGKLTVTPSTTGANKLNQAVGKVMRCTANQVIVRIMIQNEGTVFTA